MGEEEPQITTDAVTDPSIDSQVLIEQEGPNAGAIAASETSEAKTRFWQEDSKVIEGLPVIGATAEDTYRTNRATGNENSDFPLEPDALAAAAAKGGNEYGENMMIEEVSKRATELAKQQYPLASQRLIEQFAQKAADKFKSELETKNAETVAEHDRGVQGLIDSLDAPGANLVDLGLTSSDKPLGSVA